MSQSPENSNDTAPRATRLAMPIDFSRDHVIGAQTAPVLLLEYGDYECPDCGRAYPMLRELQSRFKDRLAFAFRHFPQRTIHRHASVAAQAAEAAAAQKKFWPMHDLLYQNQDQLEPLNLTRYALRIGIEIYRFESALSSSTYARRVEDDFASGQRSGVRGTPTLFINEERYQQRVELEPLSAALQAAIKLNEK